MEKYVLLGIVLATLQCVASQPQRRYPGHHHHKERSEKRTSTSDSEGARTVWGGSCSPRYTVLYATQDAILECEVYAPPGTVVTWYKGSNIYQGYTQTEMVEEATNEIAWDDPSQLTHFNPSSNVQISTVLYIDCASAEDMDEYVIAVEPPVGRMLKRYFSVNVSASAPYWMTPGGTCSFGQELVSYIPRIYQYAKQVLARRNYDVIIPCRVTGLEVKQGWSFGNDPIESSEKYQILANGDLIVRNVASEDRGVFTCWSTSLLAPSLSDQVITYFYPRSQ